MGDVALEIVVILVLILFNGVLAMAEIALVSSRKVRLQQRANKGDENARTALKLAQNPSNFLSTVQVGITLVGILAGAFGGATVAQPLAELISVNATLRPYSQSIALGIVVFTITYLSLIFGELVPKRLALSNPEKFAAGMAKPMITFSRLVLPLVRLLDISTELILKVLGIKPSQEPSVTEDEIKLLIKQGAHSGVFEETEIDMVNAIFRLGDRRIGTLITPRPEVDWVDLDNTLEENLEKVIQSGHSRLPVGKGSLDDIHGILVAKDLLACELEDPSFDIKTCTIPAVFVPQNMRAMKVLEVLREDPQPAMVLVIDEFGGLQGLVTANDLLEAIVGELPESGAKFEPDIVQRRDGSWLVDGMLAVDEFMEYFHLGELPEMQRGLFQTLGGLVMSTLGRVPKSGDAFDWKGLHIEVADMDGLRVDKVMVSAQVAESSVNTN
jgi:putative hemolysin